MSFVSPSLPSVVSSLVSAGVRAELAAMCAQKPYVATCSVASWLVIRNEGGM
jgi:hypothetical protein